MDCSCADKGMWLAGLFGPFLTIVGIWMLIGSEYLAVLLMGKGIAGKKGEKITKFEDLGIKDRPGVFYTWAVFLIFIGLFILTQYHSFEDAFLMFVPILGYIFFIIGLLGLFLPNMIASFMFGSRHFIRAVGIIPLVLGLVLTAAAHL